MRFLLTTAAIIALIPAALTADVKYQVRDTADLVAVCEANPRAPDVNTSLAALRLAGCAGNANLAPDCLER